MGEIILKPILRFDPQLVQRLEGLLEVWTYVGYGVLVLLGIIGFRLVLREKK